MQAEFLLLSMALVRPNAEQPREHFDEGKMGELAANIAAVGLLQPVSVRAVSGGQFELIQGERRYRACQILDWEAIPALVRHEAMDDEAMLTAALTENMQRVDMNPIEEAKGMSRLQELGKTHEQISRLLAVSTPTIASRLAWLELEPEVQALVAAGKLPSGRPVSKALSRVSSSEGRVALATQIAARSQSVKSIERAVDMYCKLESGGGGGGNYALADDGRLVRRYHKEKALVGGKTTRGGVHAFNVAGVKVADLPEVGEAIVQVCKNCYLHDYEASLPCKDCPLTQLVRKLGPESTQARK